MSTLVKENTFHSEVGILKEESYILEKVEHQCAENFIYHVPASAHPILVYLFIKKILEFSFSWGDEDFPMDVHTVIMKNDFIESLQVLQSAGETSLMPVFLKHGNVPLYLPTEQYLFLYI